MLSYFVFEIKGQNHVHRQLNSIRLLLLRDIRGHVVPSNLISSCFKVRETPFWNKTHSPSLFSRLPLPPAALPPPAHGEELRLYSPEQVLPETAH